MTKKTTKKQTTHLNKKAQEPQAKHADTSGGTSRRSRKRAEVLEKPAADAKTGATKAPEAVAPAMPAIQATVPATPSPAGKKTTKSKKSVPTAPNVAPPAAHPAASAAPLPASEKLSKLDVPALQARYLEVVGRATGSTNKAYLIWKIREAQKGRIPVGPRKPVQRKDGAFMVLPLRMEAEVVDKLDQAWKRHGLRSRMDLFRKSLHDYLAALGESDVAALLAGTAQEVQ